MLESGRELLIWFFRVELVPDVSPLAQCGLNEAFGLAVGGWPTQARFSLEWGWGMFIRHRLSPTNKSRCPYAVGTNAFSPQRAESLPHFLSLPSQSVVDR